MGLSLVYWLYSIYFALFLIEIIFIICIERVRIVPENKVFVHLAFLMFLWVFSRSWLMPRKPLLKLWNVVSVTVWVSDWKVDFFGILWFFLHHRFIFSILFDIFWLSSFIVCIYLGLLSKPKGKCALRS